MGRIIVFTGKGGVGKTSVAAASAVRGAADGLNTLLVSADMAHNLGDIFQTKAGGSIRKIRENLSILELDPYRLMKEEFPAVNRALSRLMDTGSSRGIGEDTMLPGFEDLFSLLKIKSLYESGLYDLILVDCAPTGETLSLLKLAEMLTWYMEKFFPVGKMAVRIMKPVAKQKYHVTLPDREAMDETEKMHAELVKLDALLKDRTVSSVRLVCIPEKMVVEETKRSAMYLNLYDYQVDGVYINRILPEHTGSSFMDRWGGIQKEYLKELEEVFADVPVTRIPWYPREIRGEDAVDHLCRDVMREEDLFRVRCAESGDWYEKTKDGYALHVKAPGMTAEEVQVRLHDLDLDIHVRNYTRRIPLPYSLKGCSLEETAVRGGELVAAFSVPDNGGDAK